MVMVNDCRAYAEKLQGVIETINFNKVVIDDSQIAKDLDKIKKSDNHMLYVLIPSSNNEGGDDSLLKNNEMLFMILNKTSNKISHDEFLDVMQETQETVKAIEYQLHNDKDEQCGFMRWFKGMTIKIDPIWDYASCHGWTIAFSMKSNV